MSDHLSTRAPSESDSGGVPVSAPETGVSPLISSLINGQQNPALEEHSDSGLTLAETERLALLDAGADHYAQTLRPPNTVRAYERAWRRWDEFCDIVSLPPDTVSRGMLAGFVRWRWLAGDSPATIDTTLGGIATGLRDRGVPVDRDVTRKAREILRHEARQAAEAGEFRRGRGQAPAVTIPQLREMSAACPDDLGGLRDRALLVVGFSIAARRSELAGLLVADITLEQNGLRVTTRFGKKGGRSVGVARGRNTLTDPVRAWLAWREAAESEPADPALRCVDRWNHLGGAMSPRAVGERVTVCAERASFEDITGHSLRAGLATSARRAGKPIEKIADQGGWARNSAALLEYIRSVDQWEDNATADIGL
ncbi:tyrosine-type recombinase/integrase [Actinomadura rugatobispora]|uniref:Tyrosine-type recombinase/integrase n=1 Tax=Actinomadura rugatobispora TaxID=1994 RepID=A0ABW0ZR82_9ACTN|nr:site-specific integrase [Actinomadura rugatobispora]